MPMLPEISRSRHCGGALAAMLLYVVLGGSGMAVGATGELACPTGVGEVSRSNTLLPNADAGSRIPAATTRAAEPIPCFVAYDEVIEKQARGKLMLVDVRKAQDYARLRIPGSINIGATALKTKAFLKRRAIVLVAAGYARRQLESLCGQLRRQGFADVAALDGGLNAWIGQGGAVSGSPLARAALSRLSPRAFMTERDNPRWLVVDLNGVPLRTSTEPFAPPVTARTLAGSAFAAPDSRTPDGAVERMQRLAGSRESKAASAPYFLVVSRDGGGYDSLVARLRDSSLHQVYFLDGGLAAYRRFLSDWQARQGARRVAMAPQSTLCGVRR